MSVLKFIDNLFEQTVVLPIIYNFPWLFRNHYSQEWGKDIEMEAKQLSNMSDREMKRKFACMTDKEVTDWLVKYREIYEHQREKL